MNALFVELPAFERYRQEYLSDEAYRGLQNEMLKAPDTGDVITGTGGLRKIRHGDAQRGKGKRGGLRVTQQRVGKTTLRTLEVEAKPAPDISAMELKAIREKLKLSRPVFAHYLRTNPRTLENWEQGRAKPNAQAALLIHLVDRYPDTVKRLAAV
ncbi:hypothetical protein [Limnohabitans sp.]|uniref:helix-turn-helix domain-containing protein n=1 Tax=Limnohabitans sp. TaxID=1907725 RepID=UPI00333ED86C